MISRAELDALFREDDRRRLEHREWMDRSELPGGALVQRNDNPAGLVFKTTENALLSASAPEPEASDEDQDPFCYAVNVFSEEVVKRFDYEERQRERLEREINFLKGQLDVALKALGLGPSPSDDDRVVDLPRGFIRKRTDNAA